MPSGVKQAYSIQIMYVVHHQCHDLRPTFHQDVCVQTIRHCRHIEEVWCSLLFGCYQRWIWRGPSTQQFFQRRCLLQIRDELEIFLKLDMKELMRKIYSGLIISRYMHYMIGDERVCVLVIECFVSSSSIEMKFYSIRSLYGTRTGYNKNELRWVMSDECIHSMIWYSNNVMVCFDVLMMANRFCFIKLWRQTPPQTEEKKERRKKEKEGPCRLLSLPFPRDTGLIPFSCRIFLQIVSTTFTWTWWWSVCM